MKSRRIHTNIYPMLLLATVILVLALLCGLCKVPSASAQGEPVQVSLDEVTVHRGQTFAMNVTVTSNTGLNAMKLVIEYDHDAMTLIGVERGDGLPSMTMTTYNVETTVGYGARPFVLFFDAITPTTDTGVVATLLFETSIEADIGDYDVTVTYDPDNTRSDYREPVALGIQQGLVHFIAGEYTARYEDYDGTVLYEKDYNDGDVPAYVGEYPSREADECYSYEFLRFQGAVSDDVHVLVYRALYEATPQAYTVFYYVDGIRTTPDQIFDGDDYWENHQFAYGTEVDLTLTPTRQNYTFVGWFADEQFTQPLGTVFMPSTDMRVYGYMRYNVRVADIPKIRLSYAEMGNGEFRVDAYMTYNSGVNGMVLTLDYDHDALEFVSYTRGTALSDMEFTTSNPELGLDQPEFKFWWNNASNSRQEGLMLSMVFDLKTAENGIYAITFLYDETTDATYHNVGGEVWYTKLDILGTAIPVGEKYHWNEPVGEVNIDVTSEDGKPLDVELMVRAANFEIAEESLERLLNQNLVVKSMYNIRLMRGGEVVTCDSDLRVAIGLTQSERQSKIIKLYYLDSEHKLVPYDSSIEDGAVVFHMRNIENWVIVADAPAPVVDQSWTEEMIRSVLLPSLLSAVTMAYALLLLAQMNKKNREIRHLKGKGGK